MSNLKKIKDSYHRIMPPSLGPGLPYYLRVGFVPVMGLIVLLALKWIERGYIQPFEDDGGIDFVPAPVIYLLSLPAGFLFWLYALREEKHFALSFSPIAALLSAAGFIIAASLKMTTHHWEITACALAACIAGCFIFISFKEFYRHAFRDQCKALIALIAMGSSAAYSAMDYHMWQRMAFSAASSSKWLLEIFGIDITASVTKHKGQHSAATLTSENFTILVYQPCSGLEGIFLFTFLLSIVILLDWKLFKGIHFIETYLIGFIFMYLANVLRISSLFVFGHIAHAPDASPLLASMQGMPVHIFHSFIGQIYYLLVFMVFAYILYAFVTPSKPSDKVI